MQGNAFRPRTVSDEVGMRLGPPFTNELIDGSIIDICGVVFLFQNPVTMAKLIRKHVRTALLIRFFSCWFFLSKLFIAFFIVLWCGNIIYNEKIK